MPDGHILVETFGSKPERHLLDIPEGGLRLHVHKSGLVLVLTQDKFCETCKGGGGATYFYAQDHRVDVDCPTCNGGDPLRWNRAREQWIAST